MEKEKIMTYEKVKTIEEIISSDLNCFGKVTKYLENYETMHEIKGEIKANVEEKAEDIDLAFRFTKYYGNDKQIEFLFVHTKDEHNYFYGDISELHLKPYTKVLRKCENGISGKIDAETAIWDIGFNITEMSRGDIYEFFIYEENEFEANLDDEVYLNFEKLNKKRTEAESEDFEIELNEGIKLKIRCPLKKIKNETYDLGRKLEELPLINLKLERIIRTSTAEVIYLAKEE